MRPLSAGFPAILAVCLAGGMSAGMAAPLCPPDSVMVGNHCVDRYEASLWQVPASNAALLTLVLAGQATLTDLTAGGANQITGCQIPVTFPGNGNWTAPLYAVSVAGVEPTACVTWFQADQACALSGKQLLRNADWQQAAAGTPDTADGSDNGSTDCNINSLPGAVPTGSRLACRSNWGAFDMVGNLAEWVAEWMPKSSACPGWGGFSDDSMCLAGADPAATTPGALIRGGRFAPGGAASGAFAILADNAPTVSAKFIGFRCGSCEASIQAAEVNESVVVSRSASIATISWDDPPGLYNVYRGSIGPGQTFAYDQTCFNPGGPLGASTVTDAEDPPVGAAFFYLVARRDQCSESVPARASDGNPIPNANACPA